MLNKENLDSKMFSNEIKIYNIYLDKLAYLKENERLKRHLEMMLAKSIEELKSIIEKDEVLMKEKDFLYTFLTNENNQILFDTEYWGRLSAREEGVKSGQIKTLKSTALKMLKENLPINIISKVTGLTPKEIKKIKNEKSISK